MIQRDEEVIISSNQLKNDALTTNWKKNMPLCVLVFFVSLCLNMPLEFSLKELGLAKILLS